jgi:hypothetical protein
VNRRKEVQRAASILFTELDGLDVHVIHLRSPYQLALPLIMTHSWPGSGLELLKTIEPLTDPTAHEAAAEDAFHRVLPSLLGYLFSERSVAWSEVLCPSTAGI